MHLSKFICANLKKWGKNMSHKIYGIKQNKSESDAKKRFFVQNAHIGEVVVDGEEHTHLSVVMRYKVGDEVILICDDDYDYFGTIKQIKKDCTIVEVTKRELNLANPKTEITAFVAMNKRETTSLIVRMLSELGVSKYVPVITKYTLGQDVTEKMDRYQKIADQSAKQCRRSKTLKILQPQNLDDAIDTFKNFDAVYFAYENEKDSGISSIAPCKKVAFVIGPVAGFDEDEATQIKNAGAVAVSLGKRILRADTACVCMASILMNLLKE